MAGSVLVVRVLGNVFFIRKLKIVDSQDRGVREVTLRNHQFVVWFPSGPQTQVTAPVERAGEAGAVYSLSSSSPHTSGLIRESWDTSSDENKILRKP